MTEEILNKLGEKSSELCKMLADYEGAAREAVRRAPIWAHWIRRRIQLAKEIDAMLSALKLEEAKGA
jgi:hypothetical protein